jgi:hypothetical protein
MPSARQPGRVVESHPHGPFKVMAWRSAWPSDAGAQRQVRGLLLASPDIVTTVPFKWSKAPLLFRAGTGEPPAFLG